MPEDAALRPLSQEELPSVDGTVLYMTPMAEKPQVLAYQVGDGGQPPTNARYEPHTVRVTDARPIADLLSLDVEGVAFAPHRSSVKDWYEEAELDTVAHAEAAELVKRATSARRVEVFDHTFRRNAPDLADRTPGQARQPVTRAHNDYTEWSAPQRIRDLMPDEAEALLQRRYAFVNVWRPTRGPVLESPLAVCDARSSPASDYVACDLIYRDRKGEIYTVTYNPAHRWLYFPKMTVDETILIKCFDSRADVARWSAHSAFTDPTSPANAPARESLEIRTVAFF